MFKINKHYILYIILNDINLHSNNSKYKIYHFNFIIF